MKAHGVITTLADAYAIIQPIQERRAPAVVGLAPFRQEYFRGQLSDEWHLLPGLVRDLKTSKEVEIREEKIMSEFKRRIKETNQMGKVYLHDPGRGYQNEWAWICQAQHYGIPTRLLDWSLKWEVALYFAVDTAKFDNKDGQFWVIYVPDEEILVDGGPDRQYFDIYPKQIGKTIFINSSFYWHDNFNEVTAEVRRARQHGKFSLQSYEKCLKGLDEQEEFTVDYYHCEGIVIEKYIIPAEFKSQLRLELIAQGFHGDFLYANDDAEINKIRDHCRQILP